MEGSAAERPAFPRLPRTVVEAIKAHWVVKRRGELALPVRRAPRQVLLRSASLASRDDVALLARYSRPGGGENEGEPGSGAITGTPRLGAAVVAGPTGTVA